MVEEATEFPGIPKRFKHSSGSLSSHSTNSGTAKNRNENNIKNVDALRRLAFIFIVCLAKWVRIKVKEAVIIKVYR